MARASTGRPSLSGLDTPPQTQLLGDRPAIASSPPCTANTKLPPRELPSSDRLRLAEAKIIRQQAEIAELKAKNQDLLQQQRTASHQATQAQEAQQELWCYASSCEAKSSSLEKQLSDLKDINEELEGDITMLHYQLDQHIAEEEELKREVSTMAKTINQYQLELVRVAVNAELGQESEWDMGELIGEGGYGKVFSLVSAAHEEQFALKIVEVEDNDQLESFSSEIRVQDKAYQLAVDLHEAGRIPAVQIAQPISWGSVVDPASGHRLCFLVTPLAEYGTMDRVWKGLVGILRSPDTHECPKTLKETEDTMVALLKSFADAIW